MNSIKPLDLALLISDIEGSTRLSARLGDSFAGVIKKHNEIISSLVKIYDGKIVEVGRDNFFIVFKDPEQAVRAGVAIQQSINHHKWPADGQVRLRLGLHWGQVIPTENMYTGLEVNRTTQIGKVAHGDQILMSKAIVDQLQTKNVADLNIHKIGNYLLKDFDDSITLFQLDVPGLRIKFPLPRTVSASPSIAVLPFFNMNKDSRGDYLGLGIAEEIINTLIKNPGVRVLARASTFGVKPMQSVKELGEVLNASVILEGSLRKENGRVHITVELIDVKTGADIWIKNFSGDSNDVLAIQDEISQKVISSLVKEDLQITPPPDFKALQTQNMEAYDYYLRGNKFYNQYSLQNIQFAKQMYHSALQLDRTYVLAYCGLADCYAYMFMHDVRNETNLSKAEEFSKKAIELDSGLAQAYSSYGVALSLQENYENANQAFEKAINLDPALYEAQYQYARMAFNCGDIFKAATHFEAASRIRQDDYQALLLNGQCYDTLGFKDKAIETRINGVKIAEEVLQLNPGNVRALYMGANGLVMLGEIKKGLDWLQRAITLDPKDSMLLYNAGCIYAICNMPEQAINCLERSVKCGLTQKNWYENDSNLDVLRDNPRFKKMLASI